MNANISILSIFIVPVLLILFAALIVLQVFLAKRPGKWVGLILPIVSFVISIFLTTVTPRLLSARFFVPIVFILSNIPTVVYLVIYFVLHKKVDKLSEIKKMNIQDLE